jgi:hypothetical protein
VKRTLRALLAIAAIEGVIACTVSANVGDLSATPAESGSDAPATDSPAADGAPNDGATSDAEASIPIDAGCGVDFAHEGTSVDVQVQMASPPQFTGGTIVPGIYVLTAQNVYYAGTTGTVRIRETMRLRGSATAGAIERLTEAEKPSGSFKAYPLHGETITWFAPSAPNGPSFFLTPECPKKSFQGTGEFSAVGDTLTLFDAKDAVERVYHRVH